MAERAKHLKQADEVAEIVQLELQNLLPLLADVASGRPSSRHEQVDLKVVMTRIGRVHQLLRAVRLLAQHYYGTAIAPVARAILETWFDTAWILREPKERSKLFEASAIAQMLGEIQAFEETDGYLEPQWKLLRAELLRVIQVDPELYSKWVDPDGKLKKSYHQIKWADPNQYSQRCAAMDKDDALREGRDGYTRGLYGRAYAREYYFLSSASHGQGMELVELIEEDIDKTTIYTGAGFDDALDRLLIAVGAALCVVYEVQNAYLGGHAKKLDSYAQRLESIRNNLTI